MSAMDVDVVMANTGLLQFNDPQRSDNCVWVATAHLLGFQSVSDLESKLQLSAPTGGASDAQQQDFRIKLGNYHDRVYGKPAVWTLLNKLPITPTCDYVVVYQRANGTKHCVNRVGGRYMDYQSSDQGDDATWDVQNSTIVCSWFFELARW